MNPVLVELQRGDMVESVHAGAFAVLDADGGVLLQVGDIDRPVYPRSANKMLQALPLIETGAADRWGLGEGELALACASHHGEPRHVETVRRWLERMGLTDQVSLKGGQVFDTLELGMIAAARGYGVSMGDLLMVAEDVAQGRLSLPWPTAVASGENYYLVWPKTRPGGERLRRLSDFLQGEVRAMELPDVERLG